MIRLHIDAVSPNAVLACSLSNPSRPGELLMKPGVRLVPRVLQALRRIGVRSLWIEQAGTEVFSLPDLESLLNSHRLLLAKLQETFQQARQGPVSRARLDAVRDCLQAFLVAFLKSSRAYMRIDDFLLDQHEMAYHSGNVCLMALCMGLQLRDPKTQKPRLDAEKLVDLGMCALLHDIGKARVTPEILMKEVWDLSQRELDEVRRHTFDGYEILRDVWNEGTARVALEHHAFADGTGFPQIAEMEAEGIEDPLAPNIFVSLVTMANALDELLSRGDYLMLEALEEIYCARRAQFSSEALHSAWLALPAFVPGDSVTLSSGHGAMVVAFYPQSPFLPDVLLLTAPDGSVLSEPERIRLSLRHQPDITIHHLLTRPVEHLFPADCACTWEDAV